MTHERAHGYVRSCMEALGPTGFGWPSLVLGACVANSEGAACLQFNRGGDSDYHVLYPPRSRQTP